MTNQNKSSTTRKEWPSRVAVLLISAVPFLCAWLLLSGSNDHEILNYYQHTYTLVKFMGGIGALALGGLCVGIALHGSTGGHSRTNHHNSSQPGSGR